MAKPLRVFVAGATGATGHVFLHEAARESPPIELLLHVRPASAAKSPLANDPRARVFDLGDANALSKALADCDAVVSFVGTMRNRFSTGDTYATSDVGSTRDLVAGAVAAKVPRFLLLSSAGAGGMGAYLKMKGECERIVRESPLAGSFFRPSAFETPAGIAGGNHGARKAIPGMGALFGVIKAVPGLAGFADDYRPIPLDVVARAFLSVLKEPVEVARGKVLEGRDLWKLGARAA